MSTDSITDEPEINQKALAMFDAKLAALASREKERIGRKNMWLAHHWMDDYGERCVKVGKRHVCRRCGTLYPISLLVAIASLAGIAPWPVAFDPWPIWILSIPATLAYCGEALGLFKYSARWQIATMVLAAFAFGRAFSYELTERWSPEFWGPIAVFGGLWFFVTVYGMGRKKGLAKAAERAELITQIVKAEL